MLAWFGICACPSGLRVLRRGSGFSRRWLAAGAASHRCSETICRAAGEHHVLIQPWLHRLRRTRPSQRASASRGRAPCCRAWIRALAHDGGRHQERRRWSAPRLASPRLTSTSAGPRDAWRPKCTRGPDSGAGPFTFRQRAVWRWHGPSRQSVTHASPSLCQGEAAALLDTYAAAGRLPSGRSVAERRRRRACAALVGGRFERGLDFHFGHTHHTATAAADAALPAATRSRPGNHLDVDGRRRKRR